MVRSRRWLITIFIFFTTILIKNTTPSSVVNNFGLIPFIVDGKKIKNINSFTNKQIGKITQKRMLEGIEKQSIHEKRIWRKRNNRIRDYFHKTSKFLIEHCIHYNIGTIILGYNEGWKQDISMGKKNNQNFVYIPFLKLIEQIRYKAKLVGINFILTPEPYTSQDCCHCGRRRKNNRIKRGLYVCDICGIRINSDIGSAVCIGLIGEPQLFNRIPINDLLISPISVDIDQVNL